MAQTSTDTPPWHDPLHKILTDFKSRSEEVRQKAAKSLRSYISTQAREISGENFTKFMTDLTGSIFEFMNSPSVQERIGGIMAIDELIDVDYDENATKVTRLANYLRVGLATNDLTVMVMAAKALGRLARASGTLIAECVEFEVKRSLDWLQDKERFEPRRYAAVLILKELAQNSPTLFYVHVPSFLECIWVAIRDPKILIRETAIEGLRGCLELIAERDNPSRAAWYLRILEEAQKGFKLNSAEAIQGSLLTLGELLRNTGDFMLSKYRDICDLILRYKDHKDKMVRRNVVILLPRLAVFFPDMFVQYYFNGAMVYLLGALRTITEGRATVFIAVGEIAVAVRTNILPYLEAIVGCIKTGLTGRGRDFCPEALACTSMLASVVGNELLIYMQPVLQLMFSAGLSQALIDALRSIVFYLPHLLSVRIKLLDLLSMVLANKLFFKPRTESMPLSPAPLVPPNTDQDPQIILLALKTLGSFDFSKYQLLEFVSHCVVNYLDDDNPEIRREAAVTCATLIVRSGDATVPGQNYLVGEVLEKLLVVGIADPDSNIRRVVLASLDTRFDHHLAQAENLRSLFIALNDEVFEIRELAISVIGRLTIRNPAYVMPSLRKTLIQLLTELEFSGDSRNKEESARLLGNLIGASERLIKPYVEPILKALLPKLRYGNPRVASCVLAALGELATVGGDQLIPHIDNLLSLIMDTLKDQSSSARRDVALRTLGQLARSTGYVITPFLKYPTLLDTLLSLLKTEKTRSVRREIVKVLGILGSLDPYKHKMNHQHKFIEDKGLGNTSSSVNPSSEDYYPTLALTALMRILRDSSLSTHHTNVIQAVMFIFKSLGLKSVPFLPQIIPPLLHVMKNCDPNFREFLFQQLSVIVSTVKQNIRDYLDDVFVLIEKYWNSSLLLPIISIVEDISLALNEEFKVYLPNLIPQMLNVLHTDRAAKRTPTQKVLHALEVFDTNLDDYLHLVIPAIVKLFDQVDAPIVVRVLSIQTIGRLCQKMNFTVYASRIIHPLARVLDSPDASAELKEDAMQTLCHLVHQLGSDYAIFIPMVGKVLAKKGVQTLMYDALVTRILKNQFLTPEEAGSVDTTIMTSRKFSDSASSDDPSPPPHTSTPEMGIKKLKVNEVVLKKAWEVSQRSTRDDWVEWMRRFSIELLRESPSPALRACLSLAQDYHPLVKELFNAAFVSCWSELHDPYQEDLVSSLVTALRSQNISHEILQTLLNLAEFMEHDEKPLPIDIRTLGSLAEKCHAYAKALHYKEIEFATSPSTCIEALISINNQLQQPEAAIGILLYAQKYHAVELKESWYEKLRRWEDALSAYEWKQKSDPHSLELVLGRMRCLHALGEWERLAQLSSDAWTKIQDEPETLTAVAPLAAAAAWNLGQWESMDKYVGAMKEDEIEGAFFRAIIEVHKKSYVQAQKFIDNTRDLLDTELTALVGESYNRAYKVVVRVQQLSELEEIIEYKKSQDDPDRQDMIKKTWQKRLKGSQHNVEVWQSNLVVHSLVISPHEELSMWLKFIGLCRKGGRIGLAHKTLTMLMGKDPSQQPLGPLPNAHPSVMFAYIKQLWSAGAKKPAFEKLRVFVQQMKHSTDMALLGRIYLKLGQWQMTMRDTLDESVIPQIMQSFKLATECDTNWYKAWHSWAIINFEVVSHYEHQPEKASAHIVPAVQGFFRSIALAPDQSLQDTLRLLTLWFEHGAQKEVEVALIEGFNTVSIDTWLQVIPQIIARIHTHVPAVRRLIHELLANVGKQHPQALVYPLTVASKSPSLSRQAAASSIMDKMRTHSASLVEQSLLVSQELIRVAILWHEMWHEGLEEASRLYFDDHNVDAMLAILQPLYALLEKGPETMREVSFQQAFGRDLQEALEWCKKYAVTKSESDLNQAWDFFYYVFRRLHFLLPQMSTLELQYSSPKLLAVRDLELAVPGTYKANEPIVKISSFAPDATVITSKQRPRKLAINGSDGVEYGFLLKGHEDLRQDERVMQLFGLVNNLLTSDHETAKSHLSIQRYAVIPLSPNSGLIGWVPHSDTLHTLIRDYRNSRKILLNIETRLMLQMSGISGRISDYESLTLLEKVEVFEFALDSTNGQDLDKVLWLKSRNSEVWLDRRTNYTRSLAVMSMVGYILGLGDRHPSNIMLDRLSGRILHIDFGDCFEVAMQREKFPEKIPFRLTRMLINAMEVSGIEGNFRITCEAVMKVMRNNKESLMAVLDSFVYDPLLNWRLLTTKSLNAADNTNTMEQGKMDTGADLFDPDGGSPPAEGRPGAKVATAHRPVRGARLDEKVVASAVEMPEVLNERALQVINRVSKKLTGRDFSNGTTSLDVHAQVQRLIDQATSHENLCQCFIGWCSFW